MARSCASEMPAKVILVPGAKALGLVSQARIHWRRVSDPVMSLWLAVRQTEWGLKPGARQLLHALGVDRRALDPAMIPVIEGDKKLPSGYRPAGKQAVRIDIAEKIFRAAHEARAKTRERRFVVDPALAISTGLTPDSFQRLLGAAGFRYLPAKRLREGAFGPAEPDRFEWRPSRRKAERQQPARPREGSAFAGLADLMR